jgi:hypothetical protein
MATQAETYKKRKKTRVRSQNDGRKEQKGKDLSWLSIMKRILSINGRRFKYLGCWHWRNCSLYTPDFLSDCYSVDENKIVVMGNGTHEKVKTFGTVKAIVLDKQGKTQGLIKLSDTMHIKNGC